MLQPLLLASAERARAGDASTLERSTVDRPDDIQGPQVHAIYVLASDSVDQASDTDGLIATYISKFQSGLASVNDGVRLRIDSFQGEPDISFYRLRERTESEVDSGSFGHATSVFMNELWEDGFSRSRAKILLVVYPGRLSSIDLTTGARRPVCGLGTLNGGNIGLVSLPICGRFHILLAAPHEAIHAMGHVRFTAPHSDTTGHTTDRPDLMFASPITYGLDPGHDDYWLQIVPGLDGPALELDDYYSTFDITVLGKGGEVIVSPSFQYVTTADVDDERVCASSCTVWFQNGAPVVLQANTNRTFARFAGWSGGPCSGVEIVCTLKPAGTYVIRARFEPAVPLALEIRGKGSVRFGGRICRDSCIYQVSPGKPLTLVAKPAKGDRFVRWSGRRCGSSSNPRCRITFPKERDASLTAVFARRLLSGQT